MNILTNYDLDKSYRTEQLRKAQEHQLAESHNTSSRSLNKRLMFRLIAIVIAVITTATATQAQDTGASLDAGESLPDSFYVGIFYMQQGYLDDALRVFNEMIADDPDNPSVYAARGTVYFYLGDVEQAIADSEFAIELVPDYSMPFWTLGDIYVELGDYSQALENYTMYIDIMGGYSHPYVLEQVALCRERILIQQSRLQ